MADIIPFPRKQKLASANIPHLVDQAVYQLFAYLSRNDVNTLNGDFLRDLAVLRKLIEAMLIRQVGSESSLTRLLDEIFFDFPRR